jgi:hypothetical protein
MEQPSALKLEHFPQELSTCTNALHFVNFYFTNSKQFVVFDYAFFSRGRQIAKISRFLQSVSTDR